MTVDQSLPVAAAPTSGTAPAGEPGAALVGYQERAEWLGEPILTLRDLWPQDARAMIVGLNPSPVSVAAGHYYQGPVGQRQLRSLAEAGLFTLAQDQHAFEEAALAAGVGFTDIVKKPTVGEKDLTAEDLRVGREQLRAKLDAHPVDLIVCVFRHPVEALLGHPGRPGFQEERTASGARIFRMPGPFAATRPRQAVLAQLRDALA
ncbi:hypothetical protein E7744_02350 [Citricoccus sp. SGAir0253]|uniref:uracil-DNA glycosylase family protein n=1 Tax=Citricoccus sp. SGAir0253 TaxID=2567881 RepID=UPI0010CCFD8D|nr:uracil-DNA glycosylase family protein [Citricoccus sp. SGAir0253]QCU77187.1 hypothetical protein E7744_02350 [Citricoccus sp. SGAir0253]